MGSVKVYNWKRGEAFGKRKTENLIEKGIKYIFYPCIVNEKKEDIDIIVNLLREVKPHQIYAAGDLADPHGTHSVCLDAIMQAFDVVCEDDWFKDCYVWLYRGAWLEWEIEKVDMAVPVSPSELSIKRQAIYRHGSQNNGPAYPGDDPREFWQRAEDRNRNTADLYNKLGMAEYEAMEVFVRYKHRK